MFDSVNFYINDGKTDYSSFAEQVYTSSYDNVCNEDGVFKCTVGNVKNCIVKLGKGWMSCCGSLPKFYFGNNIQRLTLQQVKEAITLLSAALHVDLFKANITRLDIADNFSMNESVKDYFECLGNIPYLKRCYVVEDETLKYGKNIKDCRCIEFYDKNREIKDKIPALSKRMNIPKNLLRYEVRIHGRVKERLNEPIVTGSRLCEEDFFKKAIQYWYDVYRDIEKQPALRLDGLKDIKIASDLIKYILLSSLKKAGISYANYIIGKAKEMNNLGYPSEYSRVKREISKQLQGLSFKVDWKLTEELDSKVLQTYNEMMG